MADCSATGTALDRVLHSALQQQQQQGHPNGIAAAASHHAVSAFGSLLGSTASTALAGPTSLVMPAAPMETLLHSSSTVGNSSVDVRDPSSFARPSSSLVANPHHGYHPHASSLHSPPLHIMSPPQPQAMHHHPMMMMQQQYQMMQQMQMQQMHMAAMVEHQRTMQQRQQQQPPTTSGRQTRHAVPSDQMQSGTHSVAMAQTSAIGTVSSSSPQEEENDVITVGDGELDEIYNEGNTDPASIERLARAWREAEEEFAAELDEDEEYDVSNMGGVYDHLHDTTTGDASQAPSIALDPPYQFSPLSQTYGCVQTPSTDLPPTQLTYPDNLYERGLQHFHSGQLSTAILCFESTLRNVDAEHADAWRMLGKCHTENDDDSKAITCYCKSLERDPYNTETLLALVVAYVNELDWERAVETLRLWVAHHPLYAGMEGGMGGVKEGEEEEEDLYGNGLMEEEEGAGLDEDGVGGGGRGIRRMRRSTLEEMRDVERLLLRALNYNHDDDAAADVYEALGVVYNVSRDYDAAVDAFRRAIAVRPDDYQLRNKVGATLANSNRSEEALPEYRIALKLKPKYARGWLNMAISHSNLRNYSQAARCYLQTLSLNPEARHVWSYLRIALTCDEKWDLLPLAASQNLSAFHEHFDFVEY